LSSCNVSNDNTNDRCIYNYIDGSDRIETVTTGIDTYNGDIVSGICFFCKRHYEKLPFGICIRIEDEGYNDKKEYFVQDRRMCSPECTLGRIHDINLTYLERDLYDRLTREMLSAATGIKTQFKCADDYTLLEEHGGTETYKSWSSNNKKYVLLKNVVITPIKKEYKVVQLQAPQK
jgi:hypothetical protein